MDLDLEREPAFVDSFEARFDLHLLPHVRRAGMAHADVSAHRRFRIVEMRLRGHEARPFDELNHRWRGQDRDAEMFGDHVVHDVVLRVVCDAGLE